MQAPGAGRLTTPGPASRAQGKEKKAYPPVPTSTECLADYRKSVELFTDRHARGPRSTRTHTFPLILVRGRSI